jgi:thioredoxin 1
MKTVSVIVCLITMYLVSTCAQNEMKENVTCKEALELINKYSLDTAFVLLDVRTPEEYNEGHIKNAVLIDFKAADFKDKISKLDRSKTYLVYCKRGGRSAETMKLMKELGFKNLYHLYEGILVWIEKGNQIVK